jgi:tRNA(fMet)-specific endonuclease VapC
MRLALDANRYVDFARGNEQVLRCIQSAEWIGLPFVVLGELRAGFLCGSQRIKNEKMLVRFLNSARVEVLYPDEATTHLYAQLFHQLKGQGTPIPTNDIWIASQVLQFDLLLLTRDRHFEHLPQIARVELNG